MENQPLAVIVLAASPGRRMLSQQPKVLHPLAGLPLAAHVLHTLTSIAPARTVLVVGKGIEQVRVALGSHYGPDNNLLLEYASQEDQLGTGHAVLMAEPLLRDHKGPILVLYGDTPLLRAETLASMLSRHRQGSASLTLLTCIAADPTGYARVARDQNGALLGVIEERSATLVQRAISEVNSGVYLFDSAWLWPHIEMIEVNPQGEYYLADLVGMAIQEEQSRKPARPDTSRRTPSSIITFTLEGLDEVLGIKTRAQLSRAEQIVQQRLRQKWMDNGVTIFLPDTVYLGMDVAIGSDTVLYPGVVLEGKTIIGAGCVIGPNTYINNSTVEDNCRVMSAVVDSTTVQSGANLKPYTHLGPNQ